MKFEKKDILKEKRLRIFLLMLLVSCFSWLIINLSKNYTVNRTVKINFKNLKKGEVIFSKDSVLVVKVKSSGFNLLKDNFNAFVLDIDTKDKGPWTWVQNEHALNSVFNNKSEIVSVLPNTIEYKVNQLTEKKVPIVADFEIKTALGYGNISSFIKPDSLIIYGIQDAIKDVTYIKTTKLKLVDVNSSLNGSIDLVIPDFISDISHKTIEYSYGVDRFTQGEFAIPIQVKNVPENLKVNIYPKQITVQFQSSISKYNNIKPEQFLLTVDYNKKDDNSALQVMVEKTPSEIKNLRLVKSFVTYIVTEK